MVVVVWEGRHALGGWHRGEGAVANTRGRQVRYFFFLSSFSLKSDKKLFKEKFIIFFLSFQEREKK